MNYSADPLERRVERLLRSCAILPLLKGFYPLRDLILLYVRGEVSPDDPPRIASSILTPRYGRRCREAMRPCAQLAQNGIPPDTAYGPRPPGQAP